MLDEIFQVSLNGSVSEELMEIPFLLQYAKVCCHNQSIFFYWISPGSPMRFVVWNSVGNKSEKCKRRSY